MGESEPEEEIQDGLHCLLCDVAVSSDCSYSIYYTVMPHSGTLLANAIQNVIRKKLDQYSISSSFLCTKCFTLFEQLDYSEEKCKELKRGIIKGFARNTKNGELDGNSVPGVACQTDAGTRSPALTETFRPTERPNPPIVESNFKIEHVEPETAKFDESATSTEVDPISVDVDVDIADDDEDELDVDNKNKNKKIIRDTRSLRRYVHPCTICGRLFRRPCEVKQHLLSHDGAKPYKCSHCSKRFGSKSGAAIHALKKHGVDDSESILVEPKTEVDIDENNVSKDGDEDVSESQDADALDPKDLLKPETSTSESESDAQNEDFEWKVEVEENRDSEENNCESDAENPLADSVVKVEKESKKRSPQLKTKPKTVRKRVTKPRKPVNDNGKTKTAKPRIKKVPGEPIRLDCSICGKMWRTRSELKAHEATHSTERPFICEICGQAYKHKPALDVHVGMHQGINPFCCPYCKKSFTQKGALQRHLPIHTGDAPFQCELCGKRFVHHTSFNMHTLAHTGEKSYKCGVCGLALLSASHLKRHTRVHTGERPYQCPTCGKRFAERYNLAAHQRIHQHSASKLHSCQLCGAGFDRKPKLEDHLASCHNKITDDRSSHKILEDTRKWVGHPQQMPGEMVAIGHPQQAWHHMIFDQAKLQEANAHATLLPPRLNMMQ